jgi:hypothetical protein
MINEWHLLHIAVIYQAIIDFEHDGCGFKLPMNADGKEMFICAHKNRAFIFCNNNIEFGKCPKQNREIELPATKYGDSK